MKFWKDFLSFLEKQFDLLLSKIQVLNNAAGLICENMTPVAFEANSDPIKHIIDKTSEILPANESRLNLIIQNIGTEPCFIGLDSELTLLNFHFVLAADTAEYQGNGGSIELKNWHGSVFAICKGETTLSVVEY
jgi:hypothetical protein